MSDCGNIDSGASQTFCLDSIKDLFEHVMFENMDSVPDCECVEENTDFFLVDKWNDIMEEFCETLEDEEEKDNTPKQIQARIAQSTPDTL